VTQAKELQGHLAEIKTIKMTPAVKEIEFDSDNSDFENLKELYCKNQINLEN
jgi:hypothetical protein